MNQEEKFTDAQGNPQLDPTLVVDKTEDISNLTCPICLSLVNEPYDCVECDSTFCEQCIHNWFEKKNNCPQCRTTQKPKKAHKVIRAMLNSLKLYCVNRSKGCEAIISFQDISTHKCDIFCVKCEIGLKKEKHDCLALLSAEVKRLKESKLAQSQSQFYNYLKPELLAVTSLHIKCNIGHQMVLLNRACSWFCNQCMNHFSRGELAWLCALCDHDICLRCKSPLASRITQTEAKLVKRIKKKEIYLVTTSHFPCKAKCKPCVLNLNFKTVRTCNLCGNNNCQNWNCTKCTFNVCTLCSPVCVVSNSVSKPIPRFSY